MSFEELKKKSIANIEYFYKNRKTLPTIYPPKHQVFRAFEVTPPDKVKVVILGQDPYPTHGYANGLAFAINPDMFHEVPPSLLYIFQSLDRDYGPFWKTDTSLLSWAQQGVLLLNTALTVEHGKAGSHSLLWREFTEYVISFISNKKSNIVFMLWGSDACSFEAFIKNKDNHLIIKAGHPVFDKQRFEGGFRKCNDYLINNFGSSYQINW